VSAKAYCSGCGAALRAEDRFCPGCGAVGNAGAPTELHVQEFSPTNGRLQRIGDFAIDHAKGLLALLAIGALIGIGALIAREKSANENTSSPGYRMVRQLKSSGAIDNFNAILPEDDWETEYSLNDGDAHIRFRGNEMESSVPRYDDDLSDAIEAGAHREGFTG
jgi:hypothetical protein